jgi:hypothetical protein
MGCPGKSGDPQTREGEAKLLLLFYWQGGTGRICLNQLTVTED